MIDDQILVAGAGSWGTALAFLLADKGIDTVLLANSDETAFELARDYENKYYLPGVELPENLKFASVNNYDYEHKFIVNVVPTQFIRDFYSKIHFKIDRSFIINASKGIEHENLFRISELFEDIIGLDERRYCVLTGPSHAELVAQRKYTALTVASVNSDFAKIVQDIFSSNYVRIYTTDDTVGCEIGGALKNVIAIATGISDGMQLGDNAKAGLITRGLAEISRLGVAMNANVLTFSGLSGLGDLIVTCTSDHSRNRKVGIRLGRGESQKDIFGATKMIAEGVNTARSIAKLSLKYHIELPVAEQVRQILFENKHTKLAIKDLMSRDNKDEIY